MDEYLKDFAEFIKTREAASNAYISGDAKPFLAIAAKELPATFFSPGSDYVAGTKEVLEAHEKGAENFEAFDKNEFETLQMAADTDIAYWVGLQKCVVRMKGKIGPIPMTIRLTEIFRRENGEWKIVHRHGDFLKSGK